MGKMLPGSQGGSCWGPGQARKPPGGARSGAPWAPNDQDDIGDNTQHILPPGAHPPNLPSPPHKVSLSSSTYNTSKPRKPEASVA